MSAGTVYSKRYAGGFLDLPTKTTPIDQQFLNAVEAALLQLIGSAPTADGQVAQWDFANTRFGPALLLNKNIDPAAGIVKSKLNLTGANGIVDADIQGTAAIARSKLNFGSGLVNADIAATAAIVKSKLAALGIVDADVAAGAAIGRAKLERDITMVTRSVDQTITSGMYTFVAFDSELADDRDQHDNVTNNTRITFATSGMYMIGARVTWQNVPGGDRLFIIRANGASDLLGQANPRDGIDGKGVQSAQRPYPFAAGDYIELIVAQNAGSNVNVTGGTIGISMWAYRV